MPSEQMVDRLAEAEREITRYQQERERWINYTTDLQRIIEALCGNRKLPQPVSSARHHYNMAERALAERAGVVKVDAETAREALRELASVQMNLPLEDWCRISNTILAALEQAEPATAARSGSVKVRKLEWVETKTLGGGQKLIALDCFHNEFHRIDLPKDVEAVHREKETAQRRYDRCILAALEPAEPAPGARSCSVQVNREEIARIIDPHSFIDVPFTDEQVLLDMVEQSKHDALRKADRILAALEPAEPATDAEPVAVLEFARKQPGNENEMPRVVSCNWLPDGQYAVFTRPPESRLREADEGLVKFAKEMCRVGFEGGSIDGCDILDTAVEHGLCKITEYSCDMTKVANAEYLEEGDAIYVFTGPLAQGADDERA